MPDVSRQWKEKEWERYANELASMDHRLRGGTYQRIPDLNGDCGLEGVSGCGCGYQSYADQNSDDAADRTRKQKDKIHTDLFKLNKYKQYWSDYFGGKKLRIWTLLVPVYEDKEVAKYGKKQARELKKLDLPFIHNTFDVFVKSVDDYSDAIQIVRDPRLPKGDGQPVDEASVRAFKSDRPEFVANIDRKLLAAMPNSSQAARDKYRETLLIWHLRATTYTTTLQQFFPQQWEELRTLVLTIGESLESEGVFDRRPAGTRLMETRREFSGTLKSAMRFIIESDREVVSWGTLSMWLGLCPLDFPEV